MSKSKVHDTLLRRTKYSVRIYGSGHLLQNNSLGGVLSYFCAFRIFENHFVLVCLMVRASIPLKKTNFACRLCNDDLSNFHLPSLTHQLGKNRQAFFKQILSSGNLIFLQLRGNFPTNQLSRVSFALRRQR